MKKSNKKLDKYTIMVIIALLLAVSGLTFGFAAISRYVVIQSNTKVKYNEYDFKVNFSSHPNSVVENVIVPTTYPKDVKATYGYIDNRGDDSVIRNLSAEFSAPGQSATYQFYIVNSGKYASYLKSINFNNVDGKSSNKICEATGITDQATVDKACEGIKISVKLGKENPTYSTIKNINNHILRKDSYEPILVTIEYDEDALVANGDFNVKFGDIVIKYSSVD
ncbi:MAG: hypothetical protein IJY25_00875 [Bacilli bacterium]|nr:hypothetical protein [Bacilli bacterium]